MASHGVARGGGEKPITDQDRKRELQKINDYKNLVDSVNTKIREHQYTVESLELTSKLLKWNPEYYTIWNHRRRILLHLFMQETSDKSAGNVGHTIVKGLITDDLTFLLPLFRKFPKCYWIWNYRLWLLEQSSLLLPSTEAHELWGQELMLVGKMLSLDSRNFMGWGYRRTVIAALESPNLSPKEPAPSMTEQEFEYTTKMIKSNLSNFSAWHNRSKLIPRLLAERQASHEARRQFLDEELELIQRALWAGSDDQSLWFYHQYLMSSFNVNNTAASIAPDLTPEEKLEYLDRELSEILEMVEYAEDCKWVYQSLIDLSILCKDLTKQSPSHANHVNDWVENLIELDPLRAGRWIELKKNLQAKSINIRS